MSTQKKTTKKQGGTKNITIFENPGFHAMVPQMKKYATDTQKTECIKTTNPQTLKV